MNNLTFSPFLLEQIVQVELKMSDVKPLLNTSDSIAKDDFIEYCLKTALVEAIEKSKKVKEIHRKY